MSGIGFNLGRSKSAALEGLNVTMRYISLFSGIGGLDLGFDHAGMECALQVEQNSNALSVLNRRWPNVPKLEDVRNVTTETAPAVDLVCGGFPCQDVSVAGRRKGLAGSRSRLWFEFIRIIGELKPEWVVIENVPGLLSSNGGRDMGAIVGGLAKCGYWWAYRCLDAQFYGVPQRRRRVFIVASLTAGRPQKVLFEPESSPWDTPPSREAGQAVACPVTQSPYADNEAQHHKLIAFAPQAGGNTGLNVNDEVSGTLQENQRMAICNTSNGYTGGADDNDAQDNHLAWDARNLTATGDVTHPLQAKKNGYSLNFNPLVGVRRLTPLECERLQGFPDNWTAGQSDTQRYRQLGNAVAVPVAHWLGQRIVALRLSNNGVGLT